MKKRKQKLQHGKDKQTTYGLVKHRRVWLCQKENVNAAAVSRLIATVHVAVNNGGAMVSTG